MPHEHPFPHMHFSFNRELSEIYLSVMIRALGMSLIAVFIPIYLYADLGIPLNKIVFAFLLLFGVFALATPLAAHLAAKIGFKKNMMLHKM